MMCKKSDAVCSEIHTDVEFLNIKLLIYKIVNRPYRATIHGCWKIRISTALLISNYFFWDATSCLLVYRKPIDFLEKRAASFCRI